MRKVITYGVFDVLHEGHVSLLRRARAMGDHLTVGVTTNRFDQLRGKLDTYETLEKRIERVLATGLVDEVIVEDHRGQKLEDILRLGIDVLVAGSDWTGKFDYLRPHCEVVYLDRTPGVSSSAIRHGLFSPIRIGIVGSGRIARRFVPEAAAVESVTVTGVMNPNLASAEALRDAAGLEFATNDLDELLEHVDAVYVASPHETHVAYARAALDAGKHVLCEKPMAFRRSDAEMLFDLAKRRGVILAEAVKTASCPGFSKLCEVVESGVIGEVRDVEACFTKLVAPGSRELDGTRASGSFLELGSYVMLPVLRLLGCTWDNLEFETIDEEGVDLFCKARFSYGRAFGLGKCGIGVKSEGQLVVSGTRGYIIASAPWWKTTHFEVRDEDGSCVEAFDATFLGDGLRYEISNLAHLANGHEGRRPALLEEESCAMASAFELFLAGRNRA